MVNAGRLHPHVGVARGQLLAAMEIDEQVAGGVKAGRLGGRHGRRLGDGGLSQAEQQRGDEIQQGTHHEQSGLVERVGRIRGSDRRE